VPDWVRGVTARYLKQPVFLEAGGESGRIPNTIAHRYLVAPREPDDRVALVASFIEQNAQGPVIIFTQTRQEADFVAMHPRLRASARPIHGEVSQARREAVLAGFKAGEFRCLVATDVAARGLDIPAVDMVVHLGAPDNIEQYVHRSGRTGRAGRSGTSVVVVDFDDVGKARYLGVALGVNVTAAAGPSAGGALRDQTARLLARARAAPLGSETKATLDAAARELLGAADAQHAVAGLLALGLEREGITSRSHMTGRRGFTPLTVRAARAHVEGARDATPGPR
jgi:superfamily II DNA/RNA helicase